MVVLFYKRNKKTCSSCIVKLYKHLGIFKNTREVREALAFGSPLCFAVRDDFDSCRLFSLLVIGFHPNFEPIEFKFAHVKRKLMLIN